MARAPRPIWLGEDRRGWDHIRVHLQVVKDPRIGAYEFAVYCAIAAHAEAGTGLARPSALTIANYFDFSDRRARTAIKKLEELGYLEVIERPGVTSLFRLLPPPKVDIVPAEASTIRARQDLIALGLRDGWRCRYCGVNLVPVGMESELCQAIGDDAWLLPPGCAWPTKDLVKPVDQGGSDTPDNWVLACQSCNSSKGNTPAPRSGVTRGAEDVRRSAESEDQTPERGADELEQLKEQDMGVVDDSLTGRRRPGSDPAIRAQATKAREMKDQLRRQRLA